MTLKDFYSSNDWRKLRETLMNQRQNNEGLLLCEECGMPIVANYDCVAHHIKELTPENIKDAAISLNPENILLVHHKCHNKIHKRFGHSSNSRKVYLITGSPLAGKKTFVKENKGNSDLVLDLDGLWTAITMTTGSTPKALKSNLFGLRETLLEQIKTRTGRWEKAWVIMPLPRVADRDRYIEMLGAEEIHIDTEKNICLERAHNNYDIDANAYEKFIEDYWAECDR